MRRKNVAFIVILSMLLSITACGGKTDDTSKESTKESQIVEESTTEDKTEITESEAVAETNETTESEAVAETNETAESEAVAETNKTTESVEKIESVEPSKNEAETAESEKVVVTDSRFDVEIIGTCVHGDSGMNVTVYSITNISEASYSIGGSSQIIYEDENKYGNIIHHFDPWFTPGETVYGYAFMDNDSDIITETMILESFVKTVSESSENTWTDMEFHKETYTSDKFHEVVDFLYDNVSTLYNSGEYLVLYYLNDELIGITQNIIIEGYKRENGMSNPFGADKIDICWLQGVDSHKPSN